MSKFDNRSGEIKESNNYGLMRIIEYNNFNDIKVKFIETGGIIKATYQNFKKGKVKDLLFPSVYKVGYLGIGKFKTSINNKNTNEYNT